MTNYNPTAVELSRAEAERCGSRLRTLRKEIADLTGRDGTLTRQLKATMLELDVERLIDGETGVETRLQKRNASGVLDLVLLAQKHPGLVVKLARDGALKADLKAVDGLPYAGDVVDFLRPGATSLALTFKRAAA